MPEVRIIAVLGAGDMGHGVAELAALKGFDVRLRDISDDVLQNAMKKVRASLDKLVAKQQATRAEADAAFARIKATTSLGEAVSSADLVIEAVPERLDLKQKVFAEVEGFAPASAVFASNTSAMRIREIGEKLRDPKRLVGMHFFNPVLLMDLIEIIPGPDTSPEALKAVQDVSKKLGKTTVTLAKDTPGFVTSRLIGVWVGAGVMAAEAKLAPMESIDAAMKFKAGFPMGPFELADYTGLDVGTHASDYIASRLGDAYRASASLRGNVERGDLGKKTGLGFYRWHEGKMAAPLTAEQAKDFDPAIVMSVVANEAAKLVEQGVASAAQIDLAMRHGTAFPKGPLEWADEVGLDVVLKTLLRMEEATSHPLVKPYESLVELVEKGQLGRKTGRGFYEHGTSRGKGGIASYETVLVDVDEAAKVATLTLNRPHRLHAINAQLVKDLRAAFQQLEDDERVRVVVLTGAGDKAFCVGADLTDVGEMTPAKVSEVARQGHLMCLQIEKMGKPVIAAVNGMALGGGLELTLPCDLRVAARRAKFGLPEVTLGLLPAMGGTQRLPKIIGLAHAKEIALLADRFDADTAFRYGLVCRVFENETFEKDVQALAAELATRAPIALKFTKQLLNASLTTDTAHGMEMEVAAFGVLASTEDTLEGVSSMFARKKPDFKGR
ncbi:MAG TPA: enoyl-CoA hydratase-related protein [Candidatus Thermoplasmatota archaeon]|nr:enoyl-CoA hydratase-related protein [Candidatus Thermoplasmatota archaeon]